MKRLLIGLAVAYLAFAIGVFVKNVYVGDGLGGAIPIEKARGRWEESIGEVVFRYQIDHFTPIETAVYYLSLHNESDPSAWTMQSLKGDKLPVRRLSELGTYPTSNSGCYYCPTGETEFILRVGSIRWLNENEVLVGGSLRRWMGNVDHAFLFHVVRQGRSWVVKDYELL